MDPKIVKSATKLNTQGVKLAQDKKFHQAIPKFREAIRLIPDYPVFHYNLGSALREIHKFQDAADHFQIAIKLDPNYQNAYNNLSIAQQELGEIKQAEKTLLTLLSINPNHAPALNNLGGIYKRRNQNHKAIKYFKKALNNQPDYMEALLNLASAYEDIEDFPKAGDIYKEILKIDPNNHQVRYEYIRIIRQLCRWHEFKDHLELLEFATRNSLKKGQTPSESAFTNVSRTMDKQLNFEVAKSWAKHHQSKLKHSAYTRHHRPGDKIRVGYLCNDFNNHATSHLTLGLYKQHNRGQFHITAYFYGKKSNNHYQNTIRQDVDEFVDLQDLSDAEIARRIHLDKTDILVDLMGYIRNARPTILAYKPAPLQVSWLAFPGTLGADYIDYIITDEIVTPLSTAPLYSEKFAFLPHCYQINDDKQGVSTKKLTRKSQNLPKDAFVFVNFCQNYKINERLFKNWINILKNVPKSVLWFMPMHPETLKHTRQVFRNMNLNPDRLIRAEILPKPEHLKRLRLADLALDTNVYNGHTTTSDALYSGVPVITQMGRHFPSRVASSLLTNIGLPELITKNQNEYNQLAIDLATHPSKLNKIKSKLKKNVKTKPLFNTKLFVSHLEAAYKTMYYLYRTKKPPKHFRIKP